MYTTKQAAQAAGIGYSTVPHYASEWADFLSPSATPDPGETRYFTDEDIAVFKTVKVLRDQGAETDQIREVLEKGDRYELPPPPDWPPGPEKGPKSAPAVQDNAITPLGALERLVAPWENQLKAWQDRVQDLEKKLEKERGARARAEKRAHNADLARLKSEKAAAVELARAQARVKQLELKLEEVEATQEPADRPPWWKFWAND